MQTIVVKVKEIINSRGLKQKFIADKVGMSPQEFSNLLNGRKKFETELVIPFCNALGITANELFGMQETQETRKGG